MRPHARACGGSQSSFRNVHAAVAFWLACETTHAHVLPHTFPPLRGLVCFSDAGACATDCPARPLVVAHREVARFERRVSRSADESNARTELELDLEPSRAVASRLIGESGGGGGSSSSVRGLRSRSITRSLSITGSSFGLGGAEGGRARPRRSGVGGGGGGGGGGATPELCCAA